MRKIECSGGELYGECSFVVIDGKVIGKEGTKYLFGENGRYHKKILVKTTEKTKHVLPSSSVQSETGN